MKVCGFSFIKNAVKFDYPIKEALESILPLCDHFIVAVGDCTDGTRELIQAINSDKIEIIDTVWDASNRKNGTVLADETNKAFQAIPAEYDWCFYIQGDEVIHEKYHATIKKAMHENVNDERVDGLLFNYLHFWGSFDYVGDSRRWYRKEIRIVRNNKNVVSYRDAQGFRWNNNEKLNVAVIAAEVYHYGWVRPPHKMSAKTENFESLYNPDKKVNNKIEDFDYSNNFDSLAKFDGTHPKVMLNRIAAYNWHPILDTQTKRFNFKYRLLFWFEKVFNYRPFEYRNYKIVKR